MVKLTGNLCMSSVQSRARPVKLSLSPHQHIGSDQREGSWTELGCEHTSAVGGSWSMPMQIPLKEGHQDILLK
jgi:hypothetical protein